VTGLIYIHNAAIAQTSAVVIIKMPSFKKVHALTIKFSRRKATSQSMVAREPVMERFGPKSIPIKTALFTISGRCPGCTALAAIRPVGRLFMRLQVKATIPPLPQTVTVTERWVL